MVIASSDEAMAPRYRGRNEQTQKGFQAVRSSLVSLLFRGGVVGAVCYDNRCFPEQKVATTKTRFY